MYVILIHQRYRRTDRRTDGRHAIAIPRFAL